MDTRYFSSAIGQTGRVVAARILPDLDVLETLEKICAEYGIQYGMVSPTLGSLRHLTMNYVSTANPAPGQGYTTRLDMEGAFSILAGGGLVSPAEEEGKLNCHIHFVVSGKDDVVYGGHVEPGTRTLTTMDLFITELLEIRIDRRKDPVTGAVVTSFEEESE